MVWPVTLPPRTAGQDEEVDTPYDASRATGTRRRDTSNSALNRAPPCLPAENIAQLSRAHGLQAAIQSVGAPLRRSPHPAAKHSHSQNSRLDSAVMKERSRADWEPDYRPESHLPPTGEHAADTMTERGTRVSLRMIMEHVPSKCARSGSGDVLAPSHCPRCIPSKRSFAPPATE